MNLADILAAWPDLQWRHHGTGMLQAYMPGRSDARVHVWHPGLVLRGMTTSGAMHDHRFGFRSTILAGRILHTRLHVHETDDGAHQIWRCPISGADGAACPLDPGERCTVTMSPDEALDAGDEYSVAKQSFHWARPDDDIAVTFVEMFDKDRTSQSRILAPYGAPPVHAFAHPLDPDLVLSLVNRAHAALLGETP